MYTSLDINSIKSQLAVKVMGYLDEVGLDYDTMDFEYDIIKQAITDATEEDKRIEILENKAKLLDVCEKMKRCTLVLGYADSRRSALESQGVNKTKITKTITCELYDMLPDAKNLRMCCANVRDEIIALNYTWFGYMASQKTIVNSIVTYEDKFQSALCIFCKMWWWYRWQGGRYRTDLSFSVFFKPRIGEEMERDLNEVQYSIRRALMLEVANQLGKHWAKVTYEDLSKVTLPADKMNSLKAIFGSMYWATLEDHERYISESIEIGSELDIYYDDQYDGIENLLIHEMIINESRLTDADLIRMSDLYDIPFETLKLTLPSALDNLHKMLLREKDKQDLFESD